MTEPALRQSQAEVLRYRSGWMGISAVPGSGKTWTLSQLAAKLLLTVNFQPDQEILIVTFANSAVDNFSSRIGKLAKEYGLLEGYGYRVRTLHGLAGDIIRERPELAGLGNDFSILDEEDSNTILDVLITHQIHNNQEVLLQLFDPDLSERKVLEIQRKPENGMPTLVNSIVTSFIAAAKNAGRTPADLEALLETKPISPLFRICLDIYRGYQDRLKQMGAVDYNDLIFLAWKCLTTDPDLVRCLAHRWPYILEDEAQDSSLQQQAILQMLAEQNGNWVRVGDTNQAIYQSFTEANPNLLREFILRKDVRTVDLPESGRSSLQIIDLANRLNQWVQTRHPNKNVRDALTGPYILPTQPGDTQQNPPSLPDALEINLRKFTPDEELTFVAEKAKAWLNQHRNDTVAILAPINARVKHIADALKKHDIEYVDALMNVPRITQETIGTVTHLVKFVFFPLDKKMPVKAFRVFYRHLKEDTARKAVVDSAAVWLENQEAIENFFYPMEIDPLDALAAVASEDAKLLAKFRSATVRWHQASYLPLDQLMLIISQDLVLEPFQLATIHKAAAFIKTQIDNHPEWALPQLISTLSEISKNERKFFNVNDNKDGFDPEQHRGKVVVCTSHKAKGLEWDKVFLTSVNSYDFPSGAPSDEFRSENWFIRDRRNLQAEILSELDFLICGKPTLSAYPGLGRVEARENYIRERLRLLYVGITRAKSSLTMSCNIQRRQTPAVAMQALSSEAQDD